MCFLQPRYKNKMLGLIFHQLEIKSNQRHRGDLSDLRGCKYNCNTNKIWLKIRVLRLVTLLYIWTSFFDGEL